jgi:hypothetical protein
MNIPMKQGYTYGENIEEKTIALVTEREHSKQLNEMFQPHESKHKIRETDRQMNIGL